MMAPCFSYFDALTIQAFGAYPAKADFTRTLRTDSKGNPLSDSKDEMSDYLPGLEPGSYHIIVRTNITLSIRENINDSLKMANNICSSAGTFDITLPEITIGTRTEDTLAREGVKYYQITVPDTSDVSLRIQLDKKLTKRTKEDAGTFNEMYLKYGSMPTLSNYDESYGNPYSAKQEIIVPDTRPGIYYLMVKNNYHSAETQDITIDANLLGFELLYIDQSRGGNGGELTIKMTGTGFNYGVKPRLIKSGSGLNKTIDAKETYYTDATELYATFDLKGADQGSYDAILVQDMSRYEFIYEDMHIETTDVDTIISVPVDMYLVPDSIVTSLPSAFMIEPSSNRGFLEYKNIPENVRGGRGFESSVEVTNISNNDMIAPLYMLKVGWSDLAGPISTKLPGEDSYTPGYKKFLILADEGPAGIIRPGAKGSVRIHSTAPPANQYIRFNMMKIQNSGFEFDFDAELFWTGADKNDPNWIETIYSIEQEVGNSWEGYNRVLSNSMNKSGSNNLCVASKILNNFIGDTARILRFTTGKNLVAGTSMFGYLESFNKLATNGTKDNPDPNMLDLDDPNLELTQEQIEFILANRELIATLEQLQLTNPEFYNKLVDLLKIDVRYWLPMINPIQGRFEDFLSMFIGDSEYDGGVCGIGDEFNMLALMENKYRKNLVGEPRFVGDNHSLYDNLLKKSKSRIDDYLEAGNTDPLTINMLLDYAYTASLHMPDFHLHFPLCGFASITAPIGQMPHCFGKVNGYNYIFFIIKDIKKEELTENECSENPNADYKITYNLEFLISMKDTFDFSELNSLSGPKELMRALFVLQQLKEANPFPTELVVHDVTPMILFVDKK